MADLTLTNIATLTGDYNGISTSLESIAVVTQVLDGLTIVKSADQEVWSGGILTYTISIENTADNPLENPVITDILDPTVVSLVDESVTIAGVATTNYTYASATGLLTINLPDLTVAGTVEVTFQVQRA